MARPKRRRLTGEERRREIVEAALEEFAAHGYSGTRTRAIAARAGVSETLIFQHFSGKEALYGVALQHLFGAHPVFPDIEAAVARDDDEGVFGGLARHVLAHTRQDPRIIRLALFSALEGRAFSRGDKHGSRDDDDGADHSGPVDLLRTYVERRVASGAFRPVDAAVTALLFVEAVYMHAADRQVAVSTTAASGTAEEEVVAVLVGVFVRGLRA